MFNYNNNNQMFTLTSMFSFSIAFACICIRSATYVQCEKNEETTIVNEPSFELPTSLINSTIIIEGDDKMRPGRSLKGLTESGQRSNNHQPPALIPMSIIRTLTNGFSPKRDYSNVVMRHVQPQIPENRRTAGPNGKGILIKTFGKGVVYMPPSSTPKQSPVGTPTRLGSFGSSLVLQHPNALSSPYANLIEQQQHQLQPTSPYKFKTASNFNGKPVSVNSIAEQQPPQQQPFAPGSLQNAYERNRAAQQQEQSVQQYPIPQQYPQQQRPQFPLQIRAQQQQKPLQLRPKKPLQFRPQQPLQQRPQLQQPQQLRPQQHQLQPLPQQQYPNPTQQYPIQTQTGPQLFHYEKILQDSKRISQRPEESGYSVYEQENDDEDQKQQQPEQQPEQQQQRIPSHNFYVSSTAMPSPRSPQDFLKFMGSNEYFLPNLLPNYKTIDEQKQEYELQQQTMHRQQQKQYKEQYMKQQERLREQHLQMLRQEQQSQQQPEQLEEQLRLQQPQEQQQQQQQQEQQQEQQPQQQPYHYQQQQQRRQAQQLLQQQTPQQSTQQQPQIQQQQMQIQQQRIKQQQQLQRQLHQPDSPSLSTPSSSNVRGGNYIQSPQITATTPSAYTSRSSYGWRNRTPEPVRFEFTELDAIPATYTNSPNTLLRYKAAGASAARPGASSTSIPILAANQRNNYNLPEQHDPIDGDDLPDDEEDEDMVTFTQSPERAAAEAAPTEGAKASTKDIEKYCERICANITNEYEEDEVETVCGTDGFMYTSAAQMECYASCLNTDISVQSKGTCTAGNK